MKKILILSITLLFSSSLFAIDDVSGLSSADFFSVSDAEISTSGVKAGSNAQLEATKKKALEIGSKLLKQSEDLAKKATDYLTSKETKAKIDSAVSSASKFASDFLSKHGIDTSGFGGSPQKSQKPSPKNTNTSSNIIFANIDPKNLDKINEVRKNLLEYASSLRGIRYKYGGTTENGFDCSGYVGYVAKNSTGTRFPRTAQEIYNSVRKIDRQTMEPGDLVFFKSGGKIDHIGIYAGKYQGAGQYNGVDCFWNAANAGPRQGITVSFLTEPYWRRTFHSAGRFLPSSVEAAIKNAEEQKAL